MIFLVPYYNLDISEHKALLGIRNQPEIIYHTQTQKAIQLESHLTWVQSLKHNQDSLYLAVIENNHILGGINANALQLKEPTWGVFFSPNTSPLITSAVSFLFLDTLFLQKCTLSIHASIHHNNVSARKFSERLGFTLINRNSDFDAMSLSKDQWEKRKVSKLFKPIIDFTQNIIIQEKR